ncbi:hypothetical protein [Nocardia rhizosphaerae]|uniref:Secreted protein n=1 Tax=Nocardia rhizosphaerae TaxID=1691571 RepID=A0ABV8L4A4_9NOCA
MSRHLAAQIAVAAVAAATAITLSAGSASAEAGTIPRSAVSAPADTNDTTTGSDAIAPLINELVMSGSGQTVITGSNALNAATGSSDLLTAVVCLLFPNFGSVGMLPTSGCSNQ